jgi:hypothetical protein
MPAAKRLAPQLGELVSVLRRYGELDIDEQTATLLVGMSAAPIDRRLAPERRKRELKGRSHTKPGSLLKSQIPIRTWRNAAGEHAYTFGLTRSHRSPTRLRCEAGPARESSHQVLPQPIGACADQIQLPHRSEPSRHPHSYLSTGVVFGRP